LPGFKNWFLFIFQFPVMCDGFTFPPPSHLIQEWPWSVYANIFSCLSIWNPISCHSIIPFWPKAPKIYR